MIKSNRKQIHRIVSPLSISTSVNCTTPASPATQMFDAVGAGGSQYSPDRTLFPTVFKPEVFASAADGSWPNGKANSRLANIKWFSNGVDISLDPEWDGLYSIHTQDDDDKGTIQIFRNVGVGEIFDMVMKADLVDYRTSKIVEIVTKAKSLSTTARSEDTYALDLTEGQMLFYDPVDDRLSLDDYNRAHDLKSLSDADREIVKLERSSYLRDIPLSLKRGNKELLSSQDIRYRVYRVASDGALTELSGSFDEIIKMPSVGENLRIDMRLVSDACYLIKALIVSEDSEKELTRTQFHVKRRKRKLSLMTSNQASMSGSDIKRTDIATVKCGSRIVQHPERFLKMKWLTETSSGKRVVHNSGSVGHINLARAGVASSSGSEITSDMSVWCEGELRTAHSFVKTKGKYILINGRPVIIS